MAEIFNEQRVLGVAILTEGETIFNNQPVIGIRDGSNDLFSDNLRPIKVEEVSTYSVYNDQPVLGAVVISDGRKIYNNQLVIPTYGIPVEVNDAG